MPPRTAEQYAKEYDQKKLTDELRKKRNVQVPRKTNGHWTLKEEVIALAMEWDRQHPDEAAQRNADGSKIDDVADAESQDEEDTTEGSEDDDASLEEEEDEYEDVVNNTGASSAGASIPQNLLDAISAKNDEWVRAVRKEYRIWKEKVTLSDKEDFLEPGTAPQSLTDKIAHLGRQWKDADDEEDRIRREKAELEGRAEKINAGEFREWMKRNGGYEE
jgi:hypothetical protein